MQTRRNFLKAMLAAACAPAFVRAESLMKVATPRGMEMLDSGLVVPTQRFVGFASQGNVLVSAVTDLHSFQLETSFENAICEVGDMIQIETPESSVMARITDIRIADKSPTWLMEMG